MSQNELAKLAQGNNAFALDLYQQLRKADGNLFFSPFSLSTALALTYAGARGETESQMARVLHFEQKGERLHAAFSALREKLAEAESTGGVQLKIANSLWPHAGYPFLETYLNLALEYYGVKITPVDYARDTEGARRLINNWVEEKTERRIRELIPKNILDVLTRLVLTNAIYFKGNWTAQFDSKKTTEEDFWSPQGQVKVPMMTRKAEYRYNQTNDLQILELPYIGNKLSMLVLLPRKKDGLHNLEIQLTPEFLFDLTQKMWETDVTVYLPRFKMEAAFTLNDALIALGMPDAFSGKADFSGMDGTRELFVGYVLHKAFVDVNEEGTEASAATAVVMQRQAFSEPIEFRADHPFLFLIRENQTGSILFMGRMTKP